MSDYQTFLFQLKEIQKDIKSLQFEVNHLKKRLILKRTSMLYIKKELKNGTLKNGTNRIN